MNRLWPLLLILFACTPDVPQSAPPTESVVAEFDPGASPPLVPVPNDLARQSGLVVVPNAAGDTPAQTEFNQAYLGTLTGFPHESTARVLFSGPLDPSTVTGNVVVFDVTAGSPAAGITPALDATGDAISVAPPAGGWKRAHQYAVAVMGGTGGIRGAGGQPVIGSPTWALVSSANPLVDCPKDNGGNLDLASADCKPTVDVIPSSASDPAAKLADQTQKAVKLERLRQGYAPLLALLDNHADARRVAILWTFSIVDAGEVTFDPSRGIVPFPNDVLLSPTTGKVNLPNPKTGKALTPAECATTTDSTTLLYCGLNTLDGFSTLTSPISENGKTTAAVAQATVDPATVTTQTAALVAIKSGAPPEEQTTVSFAPCLNCLSSADASGVPQTSPQELQWQLNAPLVEKTTYLAYVTGDLSDDKGKKVIASPTFALLRLKNPLSVNGKSQVNILTDAQAAQLEPLRRALSPALDTLESSGVPRANVTLAWAFTTQSEATLLDQIHAYASSPAVQALLPPGVLLFLDATAQYTAVAKAGGVPADAIGKFYVGVFDTAVAVTGPGGTFDLAKPRPEPVTFAFAVPDSAKVPAPAAGYPITIFGHGFTRDHNDFLAIANTLAKAGQATISTDVLFHGERSSCTGSASFLSQAAGMTLTDDAACADPTTMKCNEDPFIGRCVARDNAARVPCPGLGAAAGPDPSGNAGCQALHLGACVAVDGKCEGGDFNRDAGGRPKISGWNIFSLTNFFGTRDNLRQQVIDLAELVRAFPSLSTRVAAAGGPTFDLGNINYIGQSLGGILGTLFNAVSPDTKNVVLNVAGGTLPQIILNAPSFASFRKTFLDTLAMQGILPGMPDFDQFIGIAQWIVDPADPANMAWRLTHPVARANAPTAPRPNRAAFLQFIQDDQTVPNFANLALVRAAADRSFSMMPPNFGCAPPLYCYEFVDTLEGFDATSLPAAGRHGFLLRPPVAMPLGVALTTKAQTQAVTFLATGVLK